MRLAPIALALTLAIALIPGEGLAAPTGVGLPHELGTAQRDLAGELRAARAQVDAALKLRKQRLESWQKAVAARDTAAAQVAAKKRAGAATGLEGAQRKTFALDEDVTRARSQLAAAEADVARGGAQVLSLYDALLVEQRRSVDAAAASARPAAVQAYRSLAAQRDAVRQALLPVLQDASATAASASPGADLEPRADDDVETLLEKADLARDLEQRLIRQMDAVRHRIAELEEEQAVARDVAGMVGRNALFDEEDRRLLVVRTETTTRAVNNGPAPERNSGGGGGGGGGAVGGGAPTDDADSSTPPPAFEGEPSADGVGSEAPPAAPPGGVSSGLGTVSSTTVLRTEQGLAVPATDAGLQGLLSSSTSVGSLKALQKKLQSDAVRARDKAKKLRVEAEQRQ